MNTLTSLTGAEIRQLAKQNAAGGKLLNPMMDVVFKTLFSGSDDDSSAALRSLLSACTGREVTDVKVLNSEIQPEHLDAKTVRMDMHVSFNDGQMVGMEMQFDSRQAKAPRKRRGSRNAACPSPRNAPVYWQMREGFSLSSGRGDNQQSRAAFGAARLLSGQGRGRKYRELKRVYQIFFVNSILFPQNSRVPRRYFLMEEQDHDILTDMMEVIFYELPKLKMKVRAYCEGRKALKGFSEEEKWCIYLKYRHETQAADLIAELCRKEPGIMSVETVLKRVSRDEEQWAKQLFREKAAMDYRSGMGAARDEGLAKGIAIGRSEGIAIGDARGFARARLEYETKTGQDKLETGRGMKADGFSTEQIKKYTGLPFDVIEKL